MLVDSLSYYFHNNFTNNNHHLNLNFVFVVLMTNNDFFFVEIDLVRQKNERIISFTIEISKCFINCVLI